MGYTTYIISVIVLILGLVVAIAPRQCTRREMQSDEAAVKKNRGIGILIALIGAMMLAVNILFIKI